MKQLNRMISGKNRYELAVWIERALAAIPIEILNQKRNLN